ncbi:cerebellin 11 [Megalobrama amblycephala]|uniref:cerebellin 11 n=1 Tax=Megalobrama amblycephala TaxID=75352 RepID=UPI002013C243|nr:cerebellin 11 [Megalobrama amblycephala]
MALFQIFLISILNSCMAQDEDIMTPALNIYSELKELKASLDGLTTDLNAAKIELEEQKSLIQDLQKQIKGVFTAPVKGVYYFRYSGSAFASHDMGLSIFKGTSRFVSSYEYNSGERNDQMSNGAVMELDVEEEVHVRLWVRCWIFVDRRYNYSTFTGYLLYPQDSASV